MKLTKTLLKKLITEVVSDEFGSSNIITSKEDTRKAERSNALVQKIINSLRSLKTKNIEKYIEYNADLVKATSIEDFEALASALEVVTESGEER
jgi:hypothetical protein